MVEIFSMVVSAPCRAVLLKGTANALNVEHSIKNINLMKQEQMAEDFVAMNPAHVVPTIKDGDFVLWESRAILQYLCNKYDKENKFYPVDAQARARVDYLLNFDLGTLYKAIGEYVYPIWLYKQAPDAEKLKAMEAKFEFIEQHLLKGAYLNGDSPTIADISISCSLYVPTFVGFKFCPEKYPKITAFREKMATFANNEELSAQIAECMKAMMAAEEKSE
ncbi:Oidioi.mRNA.OKI2018_I69.PAR.g9223.t1.cds [Oikopleura dioica]|uniref:Oidioi.mRNA.OKI2018_I69.PAR.g9223.t1.cds n=1 Tax=Oikopleura dioica TaxID=34765 RepID=A0ABN7RQ21_OIKDI|nr:Oidioi.mRNA.OKI2018_I69.PAR.g9223.t1.cds [Oikopleura dioica]